MQLPREGVAEPAVRELNYQDKNIIKEIAVAGEHPASRCWQRSLYPGGCRRPVRAQELRTPAWSAARLAAPNGPRWTTRKNHPPTVFVLRQAVRGEWHTRVSSLIEIEVKAHTRVIHRPRWHRTCTCTSSPREVSAPPVPRLFVNTPLSAMPLAAWLCDQGLPNAGRSVVRFVPLFEPLAEPWHTRTRRRCERDPGASSRFVSGAARAAPGCGRSSISTSTPRVAQPAARLFGDAAVRFWSATAIAPKEAGPRPCGCGGFGVVLVAIFSSSARRVRSG